MIKENSDFKNKLQGLEFAKGIAIIFILISYAFNFWIAYNYNLRYLFGYIFLILEFFGASSFIFLFSFSVIFTLNKKMGRIPKKANRNKVIRQSLVLILLGMLFNIVSVRNISFPLSIWGWNVLLFIGVSQMICYFALKLVRWTRLAIGILLIFLTPGVRKLLFLGKDINIIFDIIYNIIVSPVPKYPLLPYASICLFSTIFGELIFEARSLKSEYANINSVSSIIKYSLIFIAVGLFLPIFQLNLFITSENFNMNSYPFLEAYPILVGYSYVYIPGMPEFLLMASPANLFLIVGISLLIFSFSYFKIDIKKRKNKVFNFFIFFAKYPISLLFLQFIFLPIFYQLLSIELIFFVFIGYIALLGLILYVLRRFTNSILTLEFLIKILSGKDKDESI